MSTKAGVLGFSERPALFTFWTVAVSTLAASALILSAVALNVAGREARSATSVESSETNEASIGAPLWDAGKLEAMKGRVLAERARIQDYAPLWDAGKLEAMKGRVLAESARIQDYAPLWDAGKIEAMKGRVLAG
jgi:diphthamide synthase (EF-2-diphthine--ammonia ligase)